SSASMLTRSGRHASASQASNSASRRIPSDRYSSRRNPASRPSASSGLSPPSSSCHDIMKDTATAWSSDSLEETRRSSSGGGLMSPRHAGHQKQPAQPRHQGVEWHGTSQRRAPA